MIGAKRIVLFSGGFKPQAPVIALDAGSDTGTSSSDNISSSTTPTFDLTFPTGLLQGDVVTAYDNGAALTPHTVSSGEAGGTALNLGLSALTEGTHPIQFTHSRRGRASPKSNTVSYVLYTTNPTISSTTPADNATGINASLNLTATFNRNVVFGTGNITIKKTSDDTTVEAFDVTTQQGTGNGQVSISGATLTINPTADLPGVDVYVLIDSTAIADFAGNSFAGIASKTTWNFTVQGTSLFTLIPSGSATAGASGGGNATTSAMDTTAGGGAKLIVLAVAGNSTAAVSDSASNTWTALTASSNVVNCKMFYCINPTTNASHTFTANSTSGFPSISVLAFNGSGTISTDGEIGATGGTANPAAGSITPSVDNAVVITSYGAAAGDASSINGSFTLGPHTAFSGGAHYGVGIAYLIQTTKAAANPAFTLTGSTTWAARSAVFKP